MEKEKCIIEINHLRNFLGGNWVHDDVSLHVNRGEIYAIVGGSGSGKTSYYAVSSCCKNLVPGEIRVFGTDIYQASYAEAVNIQRRWGVLFQQGALFSSLTVLENILFPLREFTHLSPVLMNQVGMMKIALTGLPEDAAYKLPGELSGGMRKRAALSRALALDPGITFSG